jgi:hypothetical protein
MTTSDGYVLIMTLGTSIAAVLLVQAQDSRPSITKLLPGFNALYGDTRSEYNTDITHYNTITVVGNSLRAIESTDTHCGLPDVAQAVKICIEESVAGGALT